MAAALQKTLSGLLAVGSANHKELIEKLRAILEQIIQMNGEERIAGQSTLSLSVHPQSVSPTSVSQYTPLPFQSSVMWLFMVILKSCLGSLL